MHTGGRFSKANRSPAGVSGEVMPLKSESDDIRAVNQFIKDVTDEAVKETTVNVSRELYAQTPKDSTFTAANFNVSATSPDQLVRSVQDGRAQRQKATADIARNYRAERDGKTYIQNNTRHIVRLNAQGSARLGVPAGFVQRAVTRGVRQTSRALERRLRRARGNRRFNARYSFIAPSLEEVTGGE